MRIIFLFLFLFSISSCSFSNCKPSINFKPGELITIGFKCEME